MASNPYEPPSPFNQTHSAYVPQEARRRHSGLGIASFVMALGVAVFEFVTVMVAGVIEVSTPGGMDEQSPAAMIVGLSVCGGLFVDLIAVVLGFVALFQSETKKVFAILGLAFGLSVLLAVAALMVIGLTMQQ